MNRFNILKMVHHVLPKSSTEEVNLWREVIRQGFLDVLIISDNKKYDKIKKEAYNWFSRKNKDYKTVCSLAKVDESIINQLFLQAKKLLIMNKKIKNKSKNHIYFSKDQKFLLANKQ